MPISKRSSADLKSILTKIKQDSYEESDIQRLLLQLRGFSKTHKIIWELASFIAHPEERDRGILHEAIDVRYAILKYRFNNSTAETIDINNIPKNIFETFILGSIKLLPKKELLSIFNMTQKEAINLVCESYVKSKGYYLLKSKENWNQILPLIEKSTSVFRSEPAIEQNEIITQLNQSVRKVTKQINIDFDSKLIPGPRKSGLLFTIMCLINTSQFKLFDGKFGWCELNCSIDSNEFKEGRKKWLLNLNAIAEFPRETKYIWPLIAIKENIESYIPNLKGIPEHNHFYTPNQYHAVRDSEGNLVLRDNS